jgi:hypothetical protein
MDLLMISGVAWPGQPRQPASGNPEKIMRAGVLNDCNVEYNIEAYCFKHLFGEWSMVVMWHLREFPSEESRSGST